jgi:hypothetical protein
MADAKCRKKFSGMNYSGNAGNVPPAQPGYEIENRPRSDFEIKGVCRLSPVA